METQRLLLDTSVWISFFGNRPSTQQKRITIAKQIVNYCLTENLKLFYCSYVENELLNGANNSHHLQEMKKIADKLPSHTGNDTWDKIDLVEWENWGSLWNNDEEIKQGDALEKQLPDKKNKSNRIDRNIVVTALNQGINYILHENPKDFAKLTVDGMHFINLLEIKSLADFIQALSKP